MVSKKVPRKKDQKRKRKRKEKGIKKGRGGRRYFKPRRSKGKGKGRRTGRSHMPGGKNEEEWSDSHDDWNNLLQNEGFLADDS